MNFDIKFNGNNFIITMSPEEAIETARTFEKIQSTMLEFVKGVAKAKDREINPESVRPHLVAVSEGAERS